ncbi:MAG: Tm-1-like ATP-binding domain-containing protein [Deltaproteobacteria bacterium]|nr:Tm-1-like ATP-binding domain-containing protein [Deltaproteobacteria bacterium]
MKQQVAAIAVVGTFDSKGEEHLFLKERIQRKGFDVLTIHVGTKGPSSFPPDVDLFAEVSAEGHQSRDAAVGTVIEKAQRLIKDLQETGKISGIISAGGGTGTHISTRIMGTLPLGFPKLMVSTVASRDMSEIVGTKDITMLHSVVDILGVNSISGIILDRAAGAVCGMVDSSWKPDTAKRRIALTFFGFITEAAERIRGELEGLGYEIVPFHANGTGGSAMEELAGEGRFDGILDLAAHELADELIGGYCRGIGPQRFRGASGKTVPRLLVPGGLDCGVLEFTRATVPEAYRDRKLFFYDFRSAIRLNKEETLVLAGQMTERLKGNPSTLKILNPRNGWSEADRPGGPLHDPEINALFIDRLREGLDQRIAIEELDCHINDPAFARRASSLMHQMLQ